MDGGEGARGSRLLRATIEGGEKGERKMGEKGGERRVGERGRGRGRGRKCRVMCELCVGAIERRSIVNSPEPSHDHKAMLGLGIGVSIRIRIYD